MDQGQFGVESRWRSRPDRYNSDETASGSVRWARVAAACWAVEWPGGFHGGR